MTWLLKARNARAGVPAISVSTVLTALCISLLAGVVAAAERDSEGRYLNPHLEQQHSGLGAYLRTRWKHRAAWADYDADRDGAVPSQEPQLVADAAQSKNATVTWIGHSTVLVQHAGINVLTDPILSDYASPIRFAGPRRQSAPATSLEALPRVDVVLISHNHYDHLDAPTIRALGDGPRYFVPLGLSGWFADLGIASERVIELDWWQQRAVPGTALTITATPSQHFSGRGLFDRNASLWAAWAVEWSDFSIWFGGDTGYNPVQFREIGERFGGFDLGIIPIGAYFPREFMGPVHVDPEQAVLIHEDIRARQSMAIHWGAFELAGEHLLEPPQLLRKAVAEAGFDPRAFTVFDVGETRRYRPVSATAKVQPKDSQAIVVVGNGG